MDENRHTDPLEEFFRKQLEAAEGATPAGAGWDVPGDAVWEQVAGALPPPPRRRRALWLWWALPLALLLGGLLWLYVQERAEGRERELRIEELTQALASCGAGAVPADGVGERVPAVRLPAAAAAGAGAAEAPAGPRGLGGGSGLLAPGFSVPALDVLGAGALLDTLGAAGEIDGAAGVALPDTAGVRVAAVDMAELPVRRVQSPLLLAPVAMWRPLAVEAPPMAARRAWVLGVYVGPAQAGRRIRAAAGQARPLFAGREEFVSSAERGVLLGLQLSPRWRVETGIGRQAFEHRTRQGFRLLYRPDGETSAGGELGSTYALAVPSSYGDAEMEVDLRRDNAPPPLSGLQILGVVRTTQSYRVTTVPVVAAYRINSQRLYVEAKAGLAFNWIEDEGFRADVSLARLDFRLRQVRVRRGFSEAARSTVDAVAGLSVRYETWPGVTFFAEPTVQRSLTPALANENFSTYGRRRSLRLGVSYGL